ncbi:hypothetical protein GN956_G9096 [Arapaima gigas]
MLQVPFCEREESMGKDSCQSLLLNVLPGNSQPAKGQRWAGDTEPHVEMDSGLRNTRRGKGGGLSETRRQKQPFTKSDGRLEETEEVMKLAGGKGEDHQPATIHRQVQPELFQ